MGYIITMIILAVFTGVLVMAGAFAYRYGKSSEAVARDESDTWRFGGNLLRYGGLGFGFLVWLLVTISASVHSVDAGHVGVVKTFGAITGQTGEGLVLTFPFQTLQSETIQVQTLAFMDQESFDRLDNKDSVNHVSDDLNSFSVETQNVYIDAILRIKVDEEDVQSLYTEVGPEYVDKLIPGQVAQVFKDETVKYSAVDIAPNRELIRHAVEQRLDQELDRFSITVDALLIENIAFDAEFEQAIQAKQVATQKSQEAENLVKAREAEARQKIAEAFGNAEKLRVEAQGQADANHLLNASLTPQLIQYQAIQKLVDNISIMLLPSGANGLFDVSKLLEQAQAQK